jgi:hypothetical protein
MSVSQNVHSIEFAWARPVSAGLRRFVIAPLLAAGLLFGGHEAYVALEPPGAVIRQDLTRAGREVANLSWLTPVERVEQTVSRHFPGYRVSVDAARFPAYVTVSLHDLDHAACRDAYRLADRIEGRVVIAMQRPETPCEPGTSLIWRIMP